MSAALLERLLEQSTFYVTTNVADLAPGDDMVEVPNGGNSLNWILGHIVWWRNDMIELAGGTRPWQNGVGRQYRGNPDERRPKHFDPAAAMALSELQEEFDECSRRLERILDSASLDSETQTKLLALLGHEIYHAGQLGVLRHLAGRVGAL
jgi:uncharacterized damage-inducible protein DinB